MKTIPLSKNKETIVDDVDYERFVKFKWFTQLSGKKNGYAVRKKYVMRRLGRSIYTTIYMHREISGLQKGDKREVDHINQNTLDNRRENLRICSHVQNGWNRVPNRRNTSGYKGVVLTKVGWKATISANKKLYVLGVFEKAQDAHKSYVEAAKKLHGKFACII